MKDEAIGAAEFAKKLGVPYYRILRLLQSGVINAEKTKVRWIIPADEAEIFASRNVESIKQLKQKYVELYWQGLDPEMLQRRVADDFKENGIVATAYGFAVRTIYESLLKRGR